MDYDARDYEADEQQGPDLRPVSVSTSGRETEEDSSVLATASSQGGSPLARFVKSAFRLRRTSSHKETAQPVKPAAAHKEASQPSIQYEAHASQQIPEKSGAGEPAAVPPRLSSPGAGQQQQNQPQGAGAVQPSDTGPLAAEEDLRSADVLLQHQQSHRSASAGDEAESSVGSGSDPPAIEHSAALTESEGSSASPASPASTESMASSSGLLDQHPPAASQGQTQAPHARAEHPVGQPPAEDAPPTQDELAIAHKQEWLPSEPSEPSLKSGQPGPEASHDSQPCSQPSRQLPPFQFWPFTSSSQPRVSSSPTASQSTPSSPSEASASVKDAASSRVHQQARPQSASSVPCVSAASHPLPPRPQSASPSRSRQPAQPCHPSMTEHPSALSISARTGARSPTRHQAGTQERLEHALREQLAVPLEQWGLREVSNWLEFIGLYHYCKVFMNQWIDGQTLKELTDKQMKDDLGMHALGHRQLLRRSVAELLSSEPEPGAALGSLSQRSLMTRPSTAPAGAWSAAREVAEHQRAKLQTRLLKAKEHAVIRMNRAGDANRMVTVALEEVRQLNGEMNALERKFHLSHKEASTAAFGQSPRGDDLMGSVPWSPGGHHLVTHIERPPTNVLEESTFHPEVSRRTRTMMRNRQSPFVERQLADLSHRARHQQPLACQQELDQHYHGLERTCGDPSGPSRALQKDLDFLQDQLASVGFHDLGTVLSAHSQHAKQRQHSTWQLDSLASPRWAADSPRASSRASPRNSPRHGGRDSPRNLGKDSPRHGGRDSPRNLGKDSPRFGGRDSPRSWSRDSPRVGGSHSPRSTPRSTPRRGPTQPVPQTIRRTASLRGPAGRLGFDPATVAGISSALDACVDNYQGELQLTARQAAAVQRTRGLAKAHRLAGILQTKLFLKRYQADLEERPARRRHEAASWYRKESSTGTFTTIGRKTQLAPPPKDPETRMSEDTACMRRHLLACGWPKEELQGNMADAAPRVEQLIARARFIHQSRSDYTSRAPPQMPEDDLEALQAEHQRFLEEVHQGPQPGGDSYLPVAEPSVTPSQLEDESSPLLQGGATPLDQTLQLLVQCHRTDLDRMSRAPSERKCLMLYRLLAAQRYLEKVEHDLHARDERAEEANRATIPARTKVMTKKDRTAFLKRLEQDAAYRRKRGQELLEEVRRAEGFMIQKGREELARILAKTKSLKAQT